MAGGSGSGVRPRFVETLGVLLVFGTLTVALTWPQAALLATAVPSFDDSLLSIWRITWIAHAIGSGLPVADANIFYPESRTLAYTDAVLLQGMLATPFLLAGASPVLVYNLLILGSIALSGAAMYLLARHLTGSWPASFVAGTIFAFVTYRFDHIMHLELQATVFMPLAIVVPGSGLRSAHLAEPAGVRRLCPLAAPERHLLHRVPGDSARGRHPRYAG